MPTYSQRIGRLIGGLRGKLWGQAELKEITDDHFAPTRPYKPVRLPQAYLVLELGVKTEKIPLHQGFLVGRSPSCHVVLPEDSSVSRVHARFSKEGLGWVVRDNTSTNGTLVNGERVTVAFLKHGDQIQIGQTVLVYEEM